MMIFGASGSQRAQASEGQIISWSNEYRATILTDMIASGRAVNRFRFRNASGRWETSVTPNPVFIGLFHRIVQHRYAYPAEVRATLQAFADRLRYISELQQAAERDGITPEDIEETIERIEEGDQFDA